MKSFISVSHDFFLNFHISAFHLNAQDPTRVNLTQELEPPPQHQNAAPIQFNSVNASLQPEFHVQQMPSTNRMETLIRPASQTESEKDNSQSFMKSMC